MPDMLTKYMTYTERLHQALANFWSSGMGARETLALMATVADLVIAYTLQARLSHSTAQEEQVGAPLAAL